MNSYIPACNCHALGSLDPFCLESNGQCSCKDNAYGRRCNECQPGIKSLTLFFLFPILFKTVS